MDNFEQASRLKLRFPTTQGFLSTEDLWNLPLRSDVANKANLTETAKSLSGQIRETQSEEDFVEVPGRTLAPNILTVSLDIVKRIIEVRQADLATAATATARKEQKHKLLALLEQKKDTALSDLSLEDLQAQINAL